MNKQIITNKTLAFLVLIIMTMSTACSEAELPVDNSQTALSGQMVKIHLDASCNSKGTRLKVEKDDEYGLKTKWTESDQIVVAYGETSKTEGNIKFAYFKIENPEKDIKNDGNSASFITEIPKEHLEKIKKNFRSAIVESEDQNIITSDSKLTVDYSGQDGTAKNVAKYDVLYTKEAEFDEVNSIILHMKHYVTNVIHLKFQSQTHTGKDIERIYFNYAHGYRGLDDSENKNKEYLVPKVYPAMDCFYNKVEVADWPNNLIENLSQYDNEKCIHTPNCESLSESNTKVNVFEIGERQFDDNGNLDIYFVTPCTWLVGRMTIQMKLANSKEVLSQSVVLSYNNHTDTDNKSIIIQSKDVIDMDADNAIGMFLYDDGTYGPLLSKSIIDMKPVTPIGVITTNSVAKHLPPNFPNRQSLKSDDALGYSHYAMGLNYTRLEFIQYQILHNLYDQNIFTDYNNAIKNNNGRVYTDYILNNYSDYSNDGDKTLKQAIAELDNKPNDRRSGPFIPTSGQWRNAVNNLNVVINEEGKYDGTRHNFSLSNDGGTTIYGTMWGHTGSYNYIEDKEYIYAAEATKAMLDYFAKIKNTKSFFQPNPLDNSDYGYCWCSNAGYNPIAEYAMYSFRYDTYHNIFLDIQVFRHTIESGNMGSLVPFYAVKSINTVN